MESWLACMSHVACRMSHVACRMSHVACILPGRFAVLSDMIQRCPYTPVTALLIHELKEEMVASWPLQSCTHASGALSSKGPFVTFGASLVIDTVLACLLVCVLACLLYVIASSFALDSST
jgi:hypothetical protein